MNNEFLLNCIDCNQPFFTQGEKSFYESKGLIIPKRCKSCREKRKAEYNKKIQLEEHIRFEKNITSMSPFSVIQVTDIPTENPDGLLYVIGNGFDLAHGVKSSYWDFRNTIGKKSYLMFSLEQYIQSDNLWSNLEESLALIDPNKIYDTVDMWLDDYDAYNPEAQAADFFAAVETATAPMDTIATELPRRFNKWVKTLSLPNEARKINNLIVQGAKYLNFNYTEFAEVLYGAERVCYIHGDRRDYSKNLILGHRPDAVKIPTLTRPPKYNDSHRSYIIESGFETASYHFSWYDEATIKNSKEIISNHQAFFNSLQNVKVVVVIGHSLSLVDDDYFNEIMLQNRNFESLQWYFSCHSEKDLDKIKKFIERHSIQYNCVQIFKL